MKKKKKKQLINIMSFVEEFRYEERTVRIDFIFIRTDNDNKSEKSKKKCAS